MFVVHWCLKIFKHIQTTYIIPSSNQLGELKKIMCLFLGTKYSKKVYAHQWAKNLQKTGNDIKETNSFTFCQNDYFDSHGAMILTFNVLEI